MHRMKKILRRRVSARQAGDSFIFILYGKTLSTEGIILTISGSWKNLVVVRFSFYLDL